MNAIERDRIARIGEEVADRFIIGLSKKGDQMSERWRQMEEFENIAKNQPVFAGNTISHRGAKVLTQAGLIERNKNGDHILSDRGKQLWALWRVIPDDDAAV